MIAIVDYGVGNLHSVAKALERVGADVRVTSDPRIVRDASAVVLPGVGAFRDSMDAMSRSDLAGSVAEAVRGGRPFLGICLGLQMLFTVSEEFGVTRGLGLLPGRVVRFEGALKVPHLGWNEVRIAKPGNPLFEGVPDGTHFYFVHSYHVVPDDPAVTAATCDYGGPFTCMAWKDNVFAVQFHPEKSQEPGLRMLSNFVRLTA
jgi:glutamine amidotransferase